MTRLAVAAALCLSVSTTASGGDLVLWLELDESVGVTAPDSSGNGNDGTLVGGPIWQDTGGMIGGALEFDGSNDYVDIGDVCNVTKNFTLAACIRPDSVSVEGIISKLTDGGEKQYALWIDPSGLLRFDYERAANNWWLAGGMLSTGVWQHVAVTVDGSLNVKLYIDGAEVASSTAPSETSVAADSLNIGRWGGAFNARYFDGLIDEVRIYDRALTEAEIRAMIPQMPPKAREETAWTEQDVPVDIDVLANDTDPNGDALSVDSFDAASVAGGAVTDPGGGILSYAPPAAWTGTDSFTYRVTDGTDTDTATVTVVVGIGEPGLVGWWELDETPVNFVAADSSGLGNDGALTNMTGSEWTTGIVGGALEFDGIDDYVAIQGLNYASTGLQAASVVAWVRTASGGDQVIASFDRNEYWRLEVNGNGAGTGQIGWDLMTDAGQLDFGSSGRVDDGAWHHVVGVYDNGMAAVYIDGDLDSFTTYGTTFGTGNTRYGFLGVGSEATTFDGAKGPATYFNGRLDDVRIYNRALSAAEILALFPPLPPVAQGDNAWTEQDVPVDVDVLANDTDINADALSVESFQDPTAGGTVEDLGGGVLRYTPPGSFTGTDTFTYTVTDGSDTDTATVTIVVGIGEPGLVGWWKLDDTAVSFVALDSSGLGNDGALWNMTGSEWTTGIVDGALAFDGVDDYVHVGPVGIGGAAARTISGWAKASSTTHPAWTGVFGFTPNSAEAGSYFDVEVDNANRYVLHLYGRQDVFCRADTEWHHFAATYDGSAVVGYLDGSPVIGYTRTLGTIDEVVMGRRAPNYFNGLIDDIRVYNRALSEAEIRALIPPLPPVANADDAWTEEDVPVDVDVLANDTDINGDALSVDSFQDPTAGGTVEDLGGGVLRYTPLGSFTGVDTFTYKVTDGSDTDTATVTVTVGPAGEAGLVAHWPLDDSGTTTAPDISGNGLDGTLAGGATWAAGGIVGGALQLDGIDGHVVLPAGFNDFTQGMSITLLARPAAVRTWARFITFGNGPTSDNIILTRDGSSNSLLFVVYVGATVVGVVAAPVIALDEWQFYTVTMDGAGDLVLYKDGVEVASGTTALPANLPRTVNYIGRSAWVGNDYYEGLFDDVRVYNRPLAAAEVAAMMPQMPPAARDDSTWTNTDTPVDIDVLANDTDPNPEDTVSVDSFDATSAAVGSVTDLGGGILRYAPPAGFNGVDTFDYTVTDGTDTDTATVTVTVGPLGEVGLLAHWKLDETSGLVAADSAGTNDGTLVGDPTWRPAGGVVGGALEFDGLGDRVKVADLGTMAEVTVSLWINLNSLPANNDSIIHTDNWAAGSLHFQFRAGAGFAFAVNGCGGRSSATAFTDADIGDWHHVAATYDSATGTVSYYLDGVPDGGYTGTAGVQLNLTGGGTGSNIGSWNAGRYYDGRFDDFRIFDRALSATEVEAMYREAMPELPPAVTPFGGGCLPGAEGLAGLAVWCLAAYSAVARRKRLA